MNWFIITTNRCNLFCQYCQNEPHPDLPIEPNWEVEQLAQFLEKDENPTICFYGGEPLIFIELIQEVMDAIPADHYTLQTNGLLLHKLPTEYLNRFSSILISLDGNEKITDYSRGEGTYKKILRNIKDIRSRGYNGDLIARMAVHEKSDVYKDVLHLLNNNNLTFDNVHWQLDVQWDEGIETRWNDFPNWVKLYNKGISKLVRYWLEEMREGKIRGIVPFLGIFRNIVNETSTDLPCEAGLRSFAIRTDGVITICPLPPEYEFTIMGDLDSSTPSQLENSLRIGEKCQECEVYGLCGGRCLFAEKSKLWGEEGFEMVCETVKHLIKELEGIKEEVLGLVNNGIIKLENFEYPEYNNTTEIIP